MSPIVQVRFKSVSKDGERRINSTCVHKYNQQLKDWSNIKNEGERGVQNDSQLGDMDKWMEFTEAL